jgi:hypothetical protein
MSVSPLLAHLGRLVYLPADCSAFDLNMFVLQQFLNKLFRLARDGPDLHLTGYDPPLGNRDLFGV